MSFWKKNDNKGLNSDEFERCLKKISALSSDVEVLQNKFKILETNYNDLRGKFNRKLSGLKKEEQEEETENINTNNVILPHGHFQQAYR